VARQVENFARIVGSDQGELAMAGDVELTHNVIPQAYLPAMGEYLKLISAACKRPAICYTRASFIDTYVLGEQEPPRWFNDYDWWLAHYLIAATEHSGPPALPRGVRRDRVIIHQTSQNKVPGAGQKVGVESDGIDFNRWQEQSGRLTFAGYIAAYNGPQPPPVDPPQPPPENPCAELIAENEALKADNAKLKAGCEALIAGNERLEAENKQMVEDLMDIREITDKWY
jgi:hypothetical protein